MPGASRCIPLLNCTSDDIIAAPEDVNSCSCKTSPNGFECTTTVQPEYIKVHGKLHKVEWSMSYFSLATVSVHCVSGKVTRILFDLTCNSKSLHWKEWVGDSREKWYQP